MKEEGTVEFDENVLYHFNRLRVSQGNAWSNIIKGADVSSGVIDVFFLVNSLYIRIGKVKLKV